jgi:hypothetical protein
MYRYLVKKGTWDQVLKALFADLTASLNSSWVDWGTCDYNSPVAGLGFLKKVVDLLGTNSPFMKL